jgi:hypothetical protein
VVEGLYDYTLIPRDISFLETAHRGTLKAKEAVLKTWDSMPFIKRSTEFPAISWRDEKRRKSAGVKFKILERNA